MTFQTRSQLPPLVDCGRGLDVADRDDDQVVFGEAHYLAETAVDRQLIDVGCSTSKKVTRIVAHLIR